MTQTNNMNCLIATTKVFWTKAVSAIDLCLQLTSLHCGRSDVCPQTNLLTDGCDHEDDICLTK